MLYNNIRVMRGGALPLVLLALASGCEVETPEPPVLDIPYLSVEARDVSIPMDVVGETIGSTDVTIRARVDGFLDGIHFQEGTFVDAGDLLYTIDAQPFEAKLARANAGLAQAYTDLAKSRADLQRIRPLAEMRAVSEQDLDSAVANFEAAESFVEAAKAQVELAEIEVSYTRIHAPERGLIGLTQAEVGDFVSQQSNGGLLNTISRTDPIAVRVSIAERAYLVAARRIRAEPESADRGRRENGPLTLILADGSIYEQRGFVTKVDRTIDADTGSLTVEAEFSNPDNILRPGMFARVRFDADRIAGAILVPQRAVSELQSAHRVYVINPDDTVEVRQVQVGRRLGSEWIIESGLEVGERVAVAGLLRLRAGMLVAPRPAEATELPPVAAG